MKKNLLILTALAGILLAGCQSVEDLLPEMVSEERMTPEGKYFLTMEASKEIPGQARNDGGTKALSLDGNTLNAYWKDGEQVSVFKNGDALRKGILTVDADESDRTKALLSGPLHDTMGLTENNILILVYPRFNWDYTGQNGAAPSETGDLATKFDYATASATVQSVNKEEKTITVKNAAVFQHQQSMYRFGFKVGGTGDAIAIKGFTVSSTHNTLVRSRSWNKSDWTDNYGSICVNAASTLTTLYVSLRNTLVSSSYPADDETIRDTYSFDVIGYDNALYLGEKKIPGKVMTAQGKFISAQNISITKSNLAQSGTATEVW